MSTVFVTQLPSRKEGNAWVPTMDLTPAKEHGELRYILPPGMNHAGVADVEPIISAGLIDFKKGDFLLPLGDPTVMAIAAAFLGARQMEFKLLKWDRYERRYAVVTVPQFIF